MSHAEMIAYILFTVVIFGGMWLVISSLRRGPDLRAADPAAAAAPSLAAQQTQAPPKYLVPESLFVELDGARLHYVQAGKGPDVVLLHGIGASVFIWRFLFPLLELKHRVTAIDLAGFGKSSKEVGRDYGLDAQTNLVAGALSKIGIENAFLVGSSMGGTIALWMALQEPKRFLKVAALAPASDRSLVPASFQHFAAATPLLRRALNRRTMRVILARVLARRTLITDAVVDSYLEPFLDRGDSMRAFWAALSLLRDARLPASLKDVSAEVLVIYGERDMMVPRSVMDRLLKILPNSALLSNVEGGHHIMEDEPEWTARALEEFFAP